MKKVTFAVCGMGNRGTVYAGQQLNFPDQMQVTAMADAQPERLEYANKYLHIPQEHVFQSADELFAQPKLADIMVISTQDAQHKEHALKALELGYDLLLEKPISNKLEDIVTIANTAKRLDRKVIVCHVLRYTPFYRAVKRVLDEGKIGKVMSIEAAEHVGYYHYAHSYTRGNWHKEADSSPMILAKCSHDMDLIYWLAGESCTKLTSFGTQTYYNKNNAPANAAEHCSDCPVEGCVFRAQDFYLPRVPKWPTNVIHPEPTIENITELLNTSNYGRCVYKMDNDVVDHQTVNMVLGDHITATFQMTGFANADTRIIHILGTEGELTGNFRDKKLQYQRFGEEPQDVELETPVTFKGHGGGDTGLIQNVLRYYRGEDFDSSSITFIDRSVESHYMAFAAERSRCNDGAVVNMEDFKRSIGAE